MFTIPEKIVLADEEWLPLLQGQWVGSSPDMSFKVTDDVMQGQIGKLTQYGPVKFRVGYYDYNKTDIILIPERARDFDDYGGFAFPRIRDGEIYLRMLVYDAVMGFYFRRPGQKPKDRGGTVFRQTMGPAAANQPRLMGMMGFRDGAPGTTGTRTDAPRFCRHCGSPAKPGDNFCRQCGGKLRV